MNIKEKLQSTEDCSLNIVYDNKLEARYVQRTPDYFIAYLSSHNGCNKSCRFCHLTQTKQTEFDPSSLDDYLIQARDVLEHFKTNRFDPLTETVKFNFMARGEPMANSTVLNNAPALLNSLHNMANEYNLKSVSSISTIMPEETKDLCLTDIFNDDIEAEYNIYYSLYSVNPEFRKRWLPKAIEPKRALDKFKKWQEKTNKELIFHWAFIDGENSNDEDIENIIELLKPYNFNAKFNVVRYNPYSASQGQEPAESVLEKHLSTMIEFLGNPTSRIVPRVGYDVKASCGMFIK